MKKSSRLKWINRLDLTSRNKKIDGPKCTVYGSNPALKSRLPVWHSLCFKTAVAQMRAGDILCNGIARSSACILIPGMRALAVFLK